MQWLKVTLFLIYFLFRKLSNYDSEDTQKVEINSKNLLEPKLLNNEKTVNKLWNQCQPGITGDEVQLDV